MKILVSSPSAVPLELFYSEDERTSNLRNVGNYSLNETASHSRRLESSTVKLVYVNLRKSKSAQYVKKQGMKKKAEKNSAKVEVYSDELMPKSD
jgi:hypothetical protein